jgi:hypothetical protein
MIGWGGRPGRGDWVLGYLDGRGWLWVFGGCALW